MEGIQDFIQRASRNLSAPESAVKSATSAVLGAIRKDAGSADFEQLLGALPGASALLKRAADEGESGGGLLGGLIGQAGSALGGNLGASAGLLGMLQNSGLDAGKFGPFVSMFLEFVQSKAGKELLGRLLAGSPQLARFAG